MTKKTTKAKSVPSGKQGPIAKPATAPSKTSGHAPSPAAKAADEAVVSVDRRTGADRRKGMDRRKRNEPVAVERRTMQRRAKVSRRRQIDPTTCERDYTNDEIEFMNALDQYKRTSGRMFPTCSEVLEVIRNLGYEKRHASGTAQHAAPRQNLNDAADQGGV